MRIFSTLVATYVLVASLGWLNGYVVGAYLERRVRLERDAWPALVPVSFIDLADGARPYDWVLDGECVAAP